MCVKAQLIVSYNVKWKFGSYGLFIELKLKVTSCSTLLEPLRLQTPFVIVHEYYTQRKTLLINIEDKHA